MAKAERGERIDKQLELEAPVARVWRALTSHVEFGAWFGCTLNDPFRVGGWSRGKITTPGYEKFPIDLKIVAMEAERRFAFQWHADLPEDPERDLSNAPMTTVEFLLEKKDGGTLLRMSETGFENIPEDRRLTILRNNDEGWTQQMRNIQSHVGKAP